MRKRPERARGARAQCAGSRRRRRRSPCPASRARQRSIKPSPSLLLRERCAVSGHPRSAPRPRCQVSALYVFVLQLAGLCVDLTMRRASKATPARPPAPARVLQAPRRDWNPLLSMPARQSTAREGTCQPYEYQDWTSLALSDRSSARATWSSPKAAIGEGLVSLPSPFQVLDRKLTVSFL